MQGAYKAEKYGICKFQTVCSEHRLEKRTA